MDQKQIFKKILGALVITSGYLMVLTSAAPQPAATCQRELQYANKTLSLWAGTMEEMVGESKLPTSIHSEANTILDMIEEFGQQVGHGATAQASAVSPSTLTRDLVTIRRRANRMALDIYLNTFDMRWPQNSLQLSVIVERVQQACLDRATIQALESPPSPLGPLIN